jgi:hypothetical protein
MWTAPEPRRRLAESNAAPTPEKYQLPIPKNNSCEKTRPGPYSAGTLHPGEQPAQGQVGARETHGWSLKRRFPSRIPMNAHMQTYADAPDQARCALKFASGCGSANCVISRCNMRRRSWRRRSVPWLMYPTDSSTALISASRRAKNSVLAKPRRTVERLTQPGRRALLKATAGLAVAGIGGGVISLDAVAQSGGKDHRQQSGRTSPSTANSSSRTLAASVHQEGPTANEAVEIRLIFGALFLVIVVDAVVILPSR